jgi:hypothetical protein
MKRFMFVVLVAMLVIGLNTAIAQPPTGNHHYTFTVTALPLTVTGGTTDFAGLAVGHCYTAPADVQNPIVFPQTANGETVAFADATIAGDPDAEVYVQFTMPTRAYSTPGSGDVNYVSLSYDGTSGAWGANAAETNFFNPTSPLTFRLDSGGAGNLILSANVCVPGNVSVAGGGVYESDAVIVAEYTGN